MAIYYKNQKYNKVFHRSLEYSKKYFQGQNYIQAQTAEKEATVFLRNNSLNNRIIGRDDTFGIGTSLEISFQGIFVFRGIRIKTRIDSRNSRGEGRVFYTGDRTGRIVTIVCNVGLPNEMEKEISLDAYNMPSGGTARLFSVQDVDAIEPFLRPGAKVIVRIS